MRIEDKAHVIKMLAFGNLGEGYCGKFFYFCASGKLSQKRNI